MWETLKTAQVGDWVHQTCSSPKVIPMTTSPGLCHSHTAARLQRKELWSEFHPLAFFPWAPQGRIQVLV